MIIMVVSAPEIKMTQEVRDLLRIVTVKPLEIKLLATLPLEMSLVPMILSLTVTNVIVVLQLNKIV
jgi:hypothetical protein